MVVWSSHISAYILKIVLEVSVDFLFEVAFIKTTLIMVVSICKITAVEVKAQRVLYRLRAAIVGPV